MTEPTAERLAALDRVRDELDLVALRVKRYVALHGHRLLQQEGRLGDLYVSMEEALALSRAHSLFERKEPLGERVGWPSSAEVEQELDALTWDVERRIAQAPTPHPIDRMKDRFGLAPRDVRLLIAAAAPDLSVDLSRFYRFAWADFSRHHPTVGFLAELLADTPTEVTTIVDALGADAPLVHHGLVELASDGASRGRGLMHREVVVPDHVTGALVGRAGGLPHELAGMCSRRAPADVPDVITLVLEGHVVVTMARYVQAMMEKKPTTVALVGPPGVGRRTLVRALAARYGRGVLELDLGLAPRDLDALDRIVQQAATVSLLEDAPLFVRVDDALDGVEGAPIALARIGRALARHARGGLVLALARPAPALMRALPDAVEIAVPAPSSPRQREAWGHALADTGMALEPDLAERLTNRFKQTPGRIRRTVAAAAQQAALEGQARLGMDAVAHAIRRASDHHLGEIAEPLATTLAWSDAVLPAETEATLREVLQHARHRVRVFDEWGMRRLMAYGRGLSCLFYGPPGTGKTMMATVLAKTLERELYRVDLSRITSKWVGETEKNLARLFDEAERAQVILLFDEADSLFSQRVQGSTATDRSANNQINFLLQRMESYDGTTILTTNLDKSIDPAFKRRLRFRVFFPAPDAAERERLWRAMLGGGLPVAHDLDLGRVAEHFELTGGHIKNAVLRAAMYAAERGGRIGLAEVGRAAMAEAREMGLVVRPLDGVDAG